MKRAAIKRNIKTKKNPLRTISIEKKVGHFDDFSEKDQKKIIENYRDINVDHDWYEYTIEDMTKILELLGFNDVKIEFSGFWSQGDGASFTAEFVPAKAGELKRRLKRTQEYAKGVPTFDYIHMNFSPEELEYGSVSVYKISHHYSHSNTITSDNDDLKEFARAFSNYIYRQLEKEYEYYTSDESIAETIRANEYEFDADTLEIF